jgi:hypothetical protein
MEVCSVKYFTICILLIATAMSVAAKPADEDGATSKRSSLRIAVQKICPISGRELPRDKKLPKWIDPATKEELYLCCDKCITNTPDSKHLETIRERQASAQGECLVMENEVSSDSKSQIIGGYRIFVCCPPCFKKVEKAQEKYFSKLDSLHEQFLKKE